MIEKDDIERTLNVLKNLYDETATSSHPDSHRLLFFYSKLAILELCAWIEETQDKIILDHIRLNLQKESNIEDVRKLIKRNSSFDYSKFRSLLIHVIGIISLEKLEARLEESDTMQRIKSELGSLKNDRDNFAHTHLKEITPRYDAPSLTYGKFIKIYDLLQKIESALNAL